MQLLFVSDIHANNWSAFSTRRADGMNSRLWDSLSVFRQAEEMARAGLVDYVIVLGDLFHARYKIDVDVFFATWNAIKSLSQVVHVIILRGNHDVANKIGGANSVEAFKSICTVVDQPQRFDFAGYSVHAFPWVDDAELLRRQVAEVPPTDLVLMHVAMQEGVVGPYAQTGHGHFKMSDIPFERVGKVFAGDFHKRQTICGRFFYIGSPCQLTFGEAGEEKAMTLLNTVTGEMQTVLTNAPRFFKCDSVANYEYLCNTGYIRKEIDFVKIECSESDVDAATQLAATTHLVSVDQVSEDREALARADSAVTESDVLLIDEYARMRVPEDRRERFASVGRELLTEGNDD